MEFQCPHCTQPITFDDAEVAALTTDAEVACPACSSSIVLHPEAADASPLSPGWKPPALRNTQRAVEPKPKKPAPRKPAASTAVQVHRRLNRNLLILGSAAILILGGIAAFLATRREKEVHTTSDVANEIVNNRFFTDLIASGKITRQDLDAIDGIKPYGSGFLGVSKGKVTWEQAGELARQVAGEILLVDLAGADRSMSRRPAAQTEALLELLPTLWARDHTGEPRVIDIPEVVPVTTPGRPRPVFIHWRAPLPPPPPRPVVRIISTDPPLSTDPENPTVLNVAEDWVKVTLEYENPGLEGLRADVTPYTKGQATEGRGNNGPRLLPPGNGKLSECEFFIHDGPATIDEIGVHLYLVNPDQSSEQLGIAATLPAYARWELDPAKWHIELLSIQPPAVFSSETKEISVTAKAGEKFQFDLTAEYRTPEPTKLASNLLLRDAGILAPDQIAELQANHATTWHFDTESREGHESVNGEGQISFDLTGYAPKEPGSYTFDMNLGLFDQRTWNTIILKLHKMNLTVVP